MSGVWFWLPGFGPIRVSTVIGALIVWAVITYVRREPLTGVVAVIAWTSVFETIYHVVGIVGFHWAPANFAWGTAAVAGWVILAGALGIWPDWRIGIAFVLFLALWIATGFHYNVPGQTTPISVSAEILNEVTKSSLGLAYLVGTLRSVAAEKELVKPLVNGDGRAGVGRRLHLHRVNPWRDRAFDREVPNESVARVSAGEEGRGGVVVADDAAAHIALASSRSDAAGSKDPVVAERSAGNGDLERRAGYVGPGG